MLVGEHLDFHVARLGQVLLHQHARVAEAGLRFTLGGFQRLGQFGLALDHLHAFASATGGGLEQHRVADALRFALEGGVVLRFAVVAGHQRHAGGFHQRLGGGLAAHASMALAGGPRKISPASSQARAKPAFSERKP